MTKILLILLLNFYFLNAQTFHAYDAKKHIGKFATVCGTVASTYYAKNSKGSPTYLNFQRPYPNHVFVGVIWGNSRLNFNNSPESIFKNKNICIEGTIRVFKGMPQIYLRNKSQLKEKNISDLDMHLKYIASDKYKNTPRGKVSHIGSHEGYEGDCDPYNEDCSNIYGLPDD